MTGEERQRRRAEVAEARPGWYWWVVMVVTAVLGPGVAIGVATTNQHRSERAWCEVLALTDRSVRAAAALAPSDVRAAEAVAVVARLEAKFDCPPP